MCTFLDVTGAFSLVALDADWDLHPKNAILAVAATANAPAVPASVRPRPIIIMPPVYTRTSSTFDREIFKKLDKERFEKFDEGETILHAAIVESLSAGTVRANYKHGYSVRHCRFVCGPISWPGAHSVQHSFTAGHPHCAS
jgi:hypothetical protein